MGTKVRKIEVVKEFLHEHPSYRRYSCTANAQMIADAIPGKDRFFDVSDIPNYLPNKITIDAIEKVRSRLADMFFEPVQCWLAKNIMYNPCDANAQILLRALASENATPEDDIDEMLTALVHPGHPSTLDGSLLLSERFQYERGQEAQRVHLAEKLIANLAPLKLDGNDIQADRRRVEERRKREEQIRGMNLDQSKELRETTRLRRSDASESREIVRTASKERPAQFQQFAPWPDQGYLPPGKGPECAVPMTRFLWSKLPASECHRLLAKHGQATINRIIDEAALPAQQKT